jgi:hypothetical protein
MVKTLLLCQPWEASIGLPNVRHAPETCHRTGSHVTIPRILCDTKASDWILHASSILPGKNIYLKTLLSPVYTWQSLTWSLS